MTDAAPTAQTINKQNGIKRPDAGTTTGRLWDIADRISFELGKPAPRKSVVDEYMATVPNANQATANTQYARWVTYHGASDALRALRTTETAERRAAKEKAAADAKGGKAEEKEAKLKAAADAKAKKEEEAKAKAQAIADEKAAKAKLKAEEKEAKEKAKAEAKAEKDRLAAEAKNAKEAAEAEAKAKAAEQQPAAA